MHYLMKSGILSVIESEKKLAQIKSVLCGAKKVISLHDSGIQYTMDIDIAEAPLGKRDDVRYRVYNLSNEKNEVLMEARPGYDENDNPDVAGWPVFRVPKVDHADLMIGDSPFVLIMQNSQNYILKDESGDSVLQIIHKGIAGGWEIETTETFNPQILCGIFIFCRYIEQENEFYIV